MLHYLFSQLGMNERKQSVELLGNRNNFHLIQQFSTRFRFYRKKLCLYFARLKLYRIINYYAHSEISLLADEVLVERCLNLSVSIMST